jgi:hypothetical protein
MGSFKQVTIDEKDKDFKQICKEVKEIQGGGIPKAVGENRFLIEKILLKLEDIESRLTVLESG